MGETFSAEATGVTESNGGISWAGAGHRCGRGEPGGASGTGVGGPPSERRGASLMTPSTSRRRGWGGGRSACGPGSDSPAPAPPPAAATR